MDGLAGGDGGEVQVLQEGRHPLLVQQLDLGAGARVNKLNYSEGCCAEGCTRCSRCAWGPGPKKRICPSHLTFSAQMCLPFFSPKQPHLRYYTILYLSNSSVLSNNFFKINNFKDFLKEFLDFF